MYRLVLVLHLLGASVWVGGHLILLLSVLPPSLRASDPSRVLRYEERFERIGIPALVIQVISGLWLAHRFVPGILPAFRFDDPVRTAVAMKLILLLATILTGAHARLRLIPRLNAQRLPLLALHITLVTVLAVSLLVTGALIRTGLS